MSRSAALPIAWITLRILIVINWVIGALLVALLSVSFQRAAWLWHAMGAAPIAGQPGGEAGMRAVIAVGIVSVPITWLVLRALARVVETVRHGDPFIAGNAGRIGTIAWGLLALEILHVGVVAIGKAISTSDAPLRFGGGSGVTGWLAVVLLFVLAGVFREGAAMRADLEGTV